MADDADRAQVEIESELEHARQAAQARFRVLPIGHCHNCDEPLGRAGQLFCDRDCAQDFEKRQSALLLRGD